MVSEGAVARCMARDGGLIDDSQKKQKFLDPRCGANAKLMSDSSLRVRELTERKESWVISCNRIVQESRAAYGLLVGTRQEKVRRVL